MLKVQNLTKEFNNVVAVNNISFEIHPGKIFGLLGPNGAGKTTTIRMILNIIKPTQGSIEFNGKKTQRGFENLIGYLPEERGLYKKSKVIDVLRYFGELKGLSKQEALKEATAWLRRLDIESYLARRIEELSKGNQQKIQFITAVIHDPEILILDEPFSGFDPINQQLVKEILLEMVQKEKLILLSTHQMEVAENLCSSILLMNNGLEVLSGSLSEIKRNFGSNLYRIEFEGDSSALYAISLAEVIHENGNSAEIKLKDGVQPHEFLRCAVDKLKVSHFSEVEPTLNKIFLQSVKTKGSQPEARTER
ncbi:MAG: ATP-binding cassette domain-containing protein [Ignavibacteria bacterium]|jgi:ABC-2 type transport system ATP-binding protein|nr:ATP-binding cassette domain-containing protein [Ignavibacteria bacterium]MCU7505118.1 ATP-binding cassette domain-containing protein [Ignavibacteria bacterium]MCU7517507.1 ATP-binding cassette domain-containing protein [Ignavibacteria bacterium]